MEPLLLVGLDIAGEHPGKPYSVEFGHKPRVLRLCGNHPHPGPAGLNPERVPFTFVIAHPEDDARAELGDKLGKSRGPGSDYVEAVASDTPIGAGVSWHTTRLR